MSDNTPTPPATHTCDECHFALADYYAKARNRPDILYTSYKCELTGRRINAKLAACLLYRARHPHPTPHSTAPPTPP